MFSHAFHEGISPWSYSNIDMTFFPSLLMNCPLISSSQNQSKQNQTRRWEGRPTFLPASRKGGLEGKNALCSMPWGLSHKRRGSLPDRGLWSVPDHRDMLAGAEGEGVGEEKAERMGGKAVLRWVSRAARAPHSLWGWLSQPSSLNLPLAMAGLCPPWGPTGQEGRSEQTAQCIFILCWFCGALHCH